MNTFSSREEKIIKIIGRNKVTISFVVTKLFKDEKIPFDASILIANSINRIIKKCKFHKLNWTLIKIREDKKLYIKHTSYRNTSRINPLAK